jgi:dTDP-4-dehydrorhamnose 3,5-epimerase
MLIRQERMADERGSFARVFCREEFRVHGLDAVVAQCSVSINPKGGTLRGIHYQASPYEEIKLVRVTSGAIYDVLVDLRQSSSTYLDHFGIRLSATGGEAIYIPEGCAHGFLTLESNTEVHYQMNRPFEPRAGKGLRWNDRLFGIAWPIEPVLISERDASYADFRPE